MSAGGSDEVPIDAALVRRLLAAQFPQWADLPVSPVPQSGMDNATFRLGADMSVRLPRYPWWVGQVEREQRWLPRLAPHLPLPVSEPLAMGTPAEGYPFPWSVYRWLEGGAATTDGLADPVRTAIELAGFIAALQGIDPTGGPGPEQSNAFRGVPMGDARDSLAADARVRPKIAALKGMVDTDAVMAVWEAALAAPAWDGPPVWIHGDLATGNLLAVDGRLSAVIDFGTLAVGDPACDLLPAWKFLPAEARGAFRAALDVDDATWARGRGWGLAASLPVPDDPFFDDPARVTTALHHLDELIADLY
ncbi:aminoglycoside phosphotransferase (APT) family kinase protein [Spinactinospora alkalitolerans]|uniref:Aminoglycoside phosphotransferase (APT) family kinase protein n=1 Tax=Spinactinospora alkalitolerans TaxID=687207 RepID=A0A852TX62_9ACTN|nr:aminoglycoside phosphotransferase family protein [Spinactinospora alkalitolerans]NYE47492.1 aminoglycoside phosphotransferase (APT) family kinase protein [Spinactinospora alkalitolerans]